MNILKEYMLASLGFVLGAMIEFAFINYYNRMAEMKKKIPVDMPQLNNKKRKKRRFAKLAPKIEPMKNEEEKPLSGMRLFLSSINKAEMIAFFMHFSSFVLYNMVYWAQNLN